MPPYFSPSYRQPISSPYVPPMREMVTYKAHVLKGSAHQQFEGDLQRRQMQGWHLISYTQIGLDSFRRPILSATYEKG